MVIYQWVNLNCKTFGHNNLGDLDDKLKRYARVDRGRNWIITEAVFSMDGDTPDLVGLCELAESHGACVYLDEAHAIGVRGPAGAGEAAAQGVSDRIAVNVFPCGKAPGLLGAFVCGRPELKEFLVNRARSLIYSTAQPPLLVHLLLRVIAFLKSPEAEDRREHLLSLANSLRERLGRLGFSTGSASTQIVPVIVGGEADALRLAEACQREGLDVRAIRPPTVPRGTSRLRVCLQSGHTVADVERLVQVLEANQKN